MPTVRDLQVGDKVTTVHGEVLEVLAVKEEPARRGFEMQPGVDKHGDPTEVKVPKYRRNEDGEVVVLRHFLARSGETLCWFPEYRVDKVTKGKK